MLEYESMKVLFEFLAIPKNRRKHWIDTSSLQMVEFMHRQMMVITRAIVTTTQYVFINCDEVSTLDNQS
jgi:hypothetical protein